MSRQIGAVSAQLSALQVGGRGAGDARQQLQFVNDDFAVTRPEHVKAKGAKAGEEGVPVALRANFVNVALTQKTENTKIYQYHVVFEPTVDSKKARMLMVKQQLTDCNYIFDGMILFTPKKVHDDGGEVRKLVAADAVTGELVELTINLTKVMLMDDPQYNTIINLVNRKTMEMLGYHQFGRHYFDPSRSRVVPKYNLNVWPGFVSALRLHENDLLMCLDVAHKVLRHETVLEVMARHRDTADFRGAMERELLGSTVMTRYNNRTYRIDEICWDEHPTAVWELDGERMDLLEYYRTRHNVTIAEKGQPLLLSRQKPRQDSPDEQTRQIYLVPELCVLTGLTDKMRADRNVMRDMADWARMTPASRVTTSHDHLKTLHSNDATLNEFAVWGLRPAQHLVSVTGRVMPQELVKFGNNQQLTVNAIKADWSREAKFSGAFSPKDLTKWAMVFPSKVYNETKVFYEIMERLGKKLGMAVAVPITVQLDSDETRGYLDQIENVINQGAQFVLVVLPTDNELRYNAIKKLCCVEQPVPSQVVLVSTLRRTNILESIVSKVLHQINSKIGGAPWSVVNPFQRSNVMVVGYDSYRDSSSRGKSVGAAVFSMDRDLTKWYSQSAKYVDLNEDQQSVNLANFFQNGLANYKKMNECYPDRIFFFRDGVGEGQIRVVNSTELVRLQETIANVVGEKGVKLTFVIVNKRVNARFFREQSSGVFDNPQPGTVIDTVVTKPERYDFFMIPQAVNQGTVTPVSYNVIFDDNLMTPDRIQRFCYKMCHLYYNWQGTIRVPAPCMFAYKLAFLVAQSTQQPSHSDLNNLLHFL